MPKRAGRTGWARSSPRTHAVGNNLRFSLAHVFSLLDKLDIPPRALVAFDAVYRRWPACGSGGGCLDIRLVAEWRRYLCASTTEGCLHQPAIWTLHTAMPKW